MEKRRELTIGPKRITICGGGNGAHALLSLLARNCDCPLNLYLPLAGEFQRFQKAKERGRPLRLIFKGREFIVSTEELFVTQDPERAASADLITLVLPSFAHKDILDKIAPYLQPGTLLAAMPARGGFEFQASETLRGSNRKGVIIAGFQTLPWACRIREYAESVEIYGQKRRVGFATLPPCLPESRFSGFLKWLEELLAIDFVPYSNMLELTLSNQGQIIHPGIMYGAFADRLDDVYREDEVPLFYQGVDEKTANLLETMSQEILEIKEAIQSKFNMELKGVISTSQWLLESYAEDIEDKSSLAAMFQTNRSYQGLKVPVKPVGSGLFQMDVRSRYLVEDVPYGLLVSKAIAELAGVETPLIDEVIKETSKWMGVKYLVEGDKRISSLKSQVLSLKLGGNDLAETRIPQNIGLRSLEEIVEMVREAF